MFNLFKNKKDPGKPSTKPPKRVQTPHRTGVRTPNGETKSPWFRSPKPSKNNNIRDVQIRSISASAPSLNNNNENKKSSKRPLTFAEGNVTLRRGQQTSKIETAATTPDDLSRSSSITNLNADPKAKGAKPKKAESKDKLDKVADKKNDKKAVNKNNNKESEGSTDSEVETLQKQLAQMANDKTNLALQLGEQNGHIHKLQEEVKQLKMMHQEAEIKVEQLMDENSVLRKQLRDVANSPLSDNEKQQILYETHRQHSSAPASIATNLLDDGGDITACPTPEWDKHSSSNVSEVSVACLQDKIHQMQETHYSTNEELQATLQELTDLQKQLTELQQENLRLSDEKNLMFESLCRQTERLNDSRNEVESLKQLLYNDENGQFETAAEREQKLVDLLKKAQEEREALLVKQEQLGNELEDARSGNLIQNKEIGQLSERVKTLESTLDAKHAEHKQLDQELAQAKDQSSSRQIEINRLKDLLENARTKINELEQDRALSDKSELDELLDNARKEKDALESEVAHLKEQLALSKNETEKLKEQVSILQEECKVTRNNAKTTQSDLEYKLEKLQAEKIALTQQLQEFQDAVNELQVQAQCQAEDKRQLSAVLSETQRNLNESERKIADLESELGELKRIKADQEEEWEKFQKDLLTSVRVANDFKTEAQQDLEKLVMENKAGRDRIKQLEAQIEKLKGSRRKSNQFEDKIASLNRRYKQIEGLSDEQLTEEQRAVKDLKRHYERDLPRRKPIANKPKDKLAISKPCLGSVVANPKLQKFVQDSTLREVQFEPEVQFESKVQFEPKTQYKSEVQFGPEVQKESEVQIGPEVQNRIFERDVQSEIFEACEPIYEGHVRSKSLTDLPEVEPRLRRYGSIENLLDLTKPRVKKPRKKSTVTFDTLDKICRDIDTNTPEDELSNEQKFALRLREVLNKQPKKIPVRKLSKSGRKKLVISRPTEESVKKNEKLRRIINDPVIKNVGPENRVVRRSKAVKRDKGRYSAPVAPPRPGDLLKMTKSKSHNDIHFKFQVPDMYSGKEESVEFPVLPPEEFRDPVPSTAADNSAFRTFHVEKNMFKREDNYLDEDLRKAFIEERIPNEDQMKNEELDDQVAGNNTFKREHIFLDEENSSCKNEESKEEHEPIEEKISNKVQMKELDDQVAGNNTFKREHIFLDEENSYCKNEESKEESEPIEEKISNKVQMNNEQLDAQVSEDAQENFILSTNVENEETNEERTSSKVHVIIDELGGQVSESNTFKREDVEKNFKPVSEEREKSNEENEAIQTIFIKDQLKNEEINDQAVEKIHELDEEKEEFEDVDKVKITSCEAPRHNIEHKEGKLLDEDLDLDLYENHVQNEDVIMRRFYEEDLLDDDLNEEDIKVRRGSRKRYTHVIQEMKKIFDTNNEEKEETEENKFQAVPAITVNDSDSDEILLDEELVRKKKMIEVADLNVEEPPKSLLEFLEPEKIPKENRGSFEFEEIEFDDEEIERIKANYEEIPKEVYKGIYFEDEDIQHGDLVKVMITEPKTGTPKEEITVVMTLEPESSVVIEEITEEEEMKIEPSSCVIVETHNFILTEKSTSEESGEENVPTEEIVKIKELGDQGVVKFCEDIDEKEDKVKNKSCDFVPCVPKVLNEDLDERNHQKIEHEERAELVEEIDEEEQEIFEDVDKVKNHQKSEDEESVNNEDKEERNCTNLQEGDSFEATPPDQTKNEEKRGVSSKFLPEELSPEELEILHQLTKRRISRPLSDLKDEDLDLIEKLKEQYVEEIEENAKEAPPPRILSPTKLNEKPSYEPVYANYSFTSSNNRTSTQLQASISGKKPVALPRVTSLDTSTEDQDLYREFSGQVRKTRFSITYERKKGDSFKEQNQEKSAKVSDLREMFERRSKID